MGFRGRWPDENESRCLEQAFTLMPSATRTRERHVMGGAGGVSLRIHSLDRTLDGVRMDKQKEGSAHMTLSVLSLTSRIWGRSRCRSRCL